MSINDILAVVDAVIVTHTHLDHWDDGAQAALPKDIPLFAQKHADAMLLRSQGVTHVRNLSDQGKFGSVTLTKTRGQHRTNKMFSSPDFDNFPGPAMGDCKRNTLNSSP